MNNVNSELMNAADFECLAELRKLQGSGAIRQVLIIIKVIKAIKALSNITKRRKETEQ